VLSEQSKEKLRSLTIDLVLDLRAEYLHSGHGNVLKHWEQLETRMQAAARTSGSAEEFVTSYCSGLQLVGLGKPSSRALSELVDTVREMGCASEWLAMLDSNGGEISYIMSLARRSAEQRADARAEAASVVPVSRDAIEEAARNNGIMTGDDPCTK
jgi:hypothetical protein